MALSWVSLLAAVLIPLGAYAQNKSGLGPGGTRLTKPDAPSGSSSSSSSSSSGLPAGTRCVSIQCADGTVVPCNSSCPRPASGSSASGTPGSAPGSVRAPSGGGYAVPQSGAPQNLQLGVPDARQEDQARRDAEEQRRREEFARSREQALQLLKGVQPADLGVKGFDGEAGAALKDGDGTGLRDAPAPQPKKRNIVISEKTLANDSYAKGFDAILARDFPLAVERFKKARAELGDDALANGALALAEALVRVSKQRTRQAEKESHESFVAVLQGDYDRAIGHLRKALELEPANAEYQKQLAFVRGLRLGAERQSDAQGTPAARANALVNESAVPMARGDWATAVAILEAAQRLDPNDKKIAKLLKTARDNQGKRPGARPDPVRVAKTPPQECPANSGIMCTNDRPVCCMIRNRWMCAMSLEDCRE